MANVGKNGARDLERLIDRLRRFRDDRDWSQFHTAKDLAISISVEAAELLELFQWRGERIEADATLVEKAASEAADVFLYLLLLCDQLDVDLLSAASAKIDRNEKRFPVTTSFGVAKPNDVAGKE